MNKKIKLFILSFVIMSLIIVVSFANQDGITASVIQRPSDDEVTQLVKSIFPNNLPDGIIQNATIEYGGNSNVQIGTFSGAKNNGSPILQFDDGVALSSGNLKQDLELSDSKYPSTNGNTCSNKVRSRLDRITIQGKQLDRVYDYARLKFDMVLPAGSEDKDIILQYAFGSEEYMKYSDSNYNDRFAVMINGENCAKVPQTDEYIAINTVNQVTNTEFFRPNMNYKGIESLGLKVPLNGLTKTFYASSKLHAGVNTIEFVIGDVGDQTYDSVLFVKAKSFKFEKFDPGTLSIEKNGGNIVVNRVREDGVTPATHANVSFTAIIEKLDGSKVEKIYSISDDESSVVLEVNAQNEDDPNKLPFNTAKITIKDATMGSKIDVNKDKILVAIPAPHLTKVKQSGNNYDLKIKGLPNAVVVLKIDGVPQNITLDANGESTLTNVAAGVYQATQTSNGVVSANSNKLTVTKPPIITGNTGAFDEHVITKGDAYDIDQLGVTAKTSLGVSIPTGANFSVDDTLDINNAGIYTITWEAKDSGFTTTKTKVIKVKPKAPQIFNKNFKDSIINIKGEPNATVTIWKNGVKQEDIVLDANGDGIILDPPDGSYEAKQVVNGVESDAVGSVTINRKYTKPEITLNGNATIELIYGTANDTYTEQGATVNDNEDDNKQGAMLGNINGDLTEKVEIENSMIDKNGDSISIPNPALQRAGAPINGAWNTFKPFVGKYVLKYKVKDSDDYEGLATRKVKVYPDKPNQSVPATNINAEIDVDALSSATIYLYNEAGEPINIVDGQIVVADSSEEHQWDKHAWIKMEDGAKISSTVSGKFTGLEFNQKYRLRQRLYGVDSELTDPILVSYPADSPVVTLKGLANQVMVMGDTYHEKGADGLDGREHTADVVIDDSELDTNTVGVYKIKYTVTDSVNHKTATVYRTVVVKPPSPSVVIGDYVNGSFSANPNGNDIKIIGSNVTTGAATQVFQVVKGVKPNGALYKKIPNSDINNAVTILENLEKTDNTSESFAVFQTISDIQSAKTYFDIKKDNTMPVVKMNDGKKVITIKKGEAITIDNTMATAKDEEDGNITSKIRIYTGVDKNTGKVKGASNTSISLNSNDTKTVGHKYFYYSVKDSDGNSVLAVCQLDILPLAPTVTPNGDELIVTGAEPNSEVEIFIVDDGGNKKLVASAKANANGKVTFNNLENGKYVAKQLSNALESGYSDEVAFKNPAYVSVKLLDDKNQPIVDTEVITMDNGVAKKAKTDANGIARFGVDSEDDKYDIVFSKGDTQYVVEAISSIDNTEIHTKTEIVGSLRDENGIIVDLDSDSVKITLKVKKSDEYVETTKAKVLYIHGEYLLSGLSPNKEYLLDIEDKASNGTLNSIAEIKLLSGSLNSVKVIDGNLNYKVVKNSSGTPLSGVEVTLYHPDRDGNPDYSLGKIQLPNINGIKDNNVNGSKTDSKGKYGYSVHDAEEYVAVYSKSGYKDVIKVLSSSEGNLLSEDVVMKAGSNPSSSKSKTDTKSNGSSLAGGSSKKSSSKKSSGGSSGGRTSTPVRTVGNTVNNIDTRTQNANNANISSANAVNNRYKGNDKELVTSKDSVSYSLDKDQKFDSVVEQPKKGRVYINPVTGNMAYIPNNGATGSDDFKIETSNLNGEKKIVSKEVFLSKSNSNSMNQAPNTVKMELSSDRKTGFEGQDFTFDIDLKNYMPTTAKNATVAIKIPNGFEKSKYSKLNVVDGHIIIPVKDIKAGDIDKISIRLKALKGVKHDTEITGLVEVEGGSQIYPINVSNAKFKVYEVDKLYSVKPYIKGMPDGKVYKNKHVTRAEIATMLSVCLQNENEPYRNNKSTNFTDVNAGDWYSKYVEDAVRYGLFGGFKDGTFRPNKDITRAELSKVIGNYFMISHSEANPIHRFNDVDGHWAEDEINALKRYKIIAGYPNGGFGPDDYMTRETAIKMINGMLFRETIGVKQSSFSDLSLDDWASGDIEAAYRGYRFMMNDQGEFTLDWDKH